MAPHRHAELPPLPAPSTEGRTLLGLPLLDALLVALVSLAIAITIGAFAASALGGELRQSPSPPHSPTPVASQGFSTGAALISTTPGGKIP